MQSMIASSKSWFNVSWIYLGEERGEGVELRQADSLSPAEARTGSGSAEACFGPGIHHDR